MPINHGSTQSSDPSQAARKSFPPGSGPCDCSTICVPSQISPTLATVRSAAGARLFTLEGYGTSDARGYGDVAAPWRAGLAVR